MNITTELNTLINNVTLRLTTISIKDAEICEQIKELETTEFKDIHYKARSYYYNTKYLPDKEWLIKDVTTAKRNLTRAKNNDYWAVKTRENELQQALELLNNYENDYTTIKSENKILMEKSKALLLTIQPTTDKIEKLNNDLDIIRRECIQKRSFVEDAKNTIKYLIDANIE
jgi:hypothetical protein